MFKSRKISVSSTFLLANLICAFPVPAQHEHHQPPVQQQHQQHRAEHEISNPAELFFMRQGAGTASQPGQSSEHIPMHMLGNWKLMSHGYAFLNRIQQTGPRGEDQTFLTNHIMLMAHRSWDQRSSFLFRTMMTLEPATVPDRRYPLLFQTGETAFGKPIVDGQHPHDLFMEISFQYAVQLNPDTLIHFYAALIGDPALGPVAFPHRLSAQELPQATLAHHLQDSTHIAADVFTAGIKYKWLRWELCGFHGAEPDEHRWDIDQGAIDSWSTRFTIQPREEWVAQLSTGRLEEPEELEPGDLTRTTFSVSYHRPLSDGFWSSTLLFGRNHKIQEDIDLNSIGIETLWKRGLNYLTGRIETVDKDELFADLHRHRDDSIFRITAVTFGYAREIPVLSEARTGIGGNITLYSFPDELKPFYGENPKGFFLYFRMHFGHEH